MPKYIFPYREIKHVYQNKSIQFIKKTCLQFPDLLDGRPVQFVINTITQGPKDKFTFTFTELRNAADNRYLICRNVHLGLTPNEVPEGGEQESIEGKVEINTLDSNPSQHYLKIGDRKLYRPSEEGANKEQGLYERKNGFEFYNEYPAVNKEVKFLKLTLGVNKTIFYDYAVPVRGTLPIDLNKKTKKE